MHIYMHTYASGYVDQDIRDGSGVGVRARVRVNQGRGSGMGSSMRPTFPHLLAQVDQHIRDGMLAHPGRPYVICVSRVLGRALVCSSTDVDLTRVTMRVRMKTRVKNEDDSEVARVRTRARARTRARVRLRARVRV